MEDHAVRKRQHLKKRRVGSGTTIDKIWEIAQLELMDEEKKKIKMKILQKEERKIKKQWSKKMIQMEALMKGGEGEQAESSDEEERERREEEESVKKKWDDTTRLLVVVTVTVRMRMTTPRTREKRTNRLSVQGSKRN